jgi:DNA-binding CsgD family transcriptional regulator
VHLPVADHPLSDHEIRERFGPLIRAGVQAFRDDPEYLVDVAEDWARVHRAPPRLTKAEREVLAMEQHRRAALTRELREQQAEALREAFEAGRSSDDIGRELRMSAATVRKRWTSMGLYVSQRSRNRSGPGRPRNAEVEVREVQVRQHFEQGLTQQQSADRLGISQAGVAGIRRRLGIASRAPSNAT